MNALRAESPSGDIAFDGETVEVHRKQWRKKGLPARRIAIGDIARVDYKEPSALISGYIRIAVPGQTERFVSSDLNHVAFEKKQVETFRAVRDELATALMVRGELSAEAASRIETSNLAAASERLRELVPQMAPFANYAGHMVRKGNYQHGLGIKRSIAGASAEFESGADRSRPTLTRIGAGALLAGPVGAIAGGMFKKDRTKVYVTIVFPDGATVIVDGPAKDEKKLRQFANSVNAIAADESRRAGTDQPAEVTAVVPSTADQLLKLKELHNAGVLTDDEYEKKSAPLIEAL